jgi:hypothetical protein
VVDTDDAPPTFIAPRPSFQADAADAPRPGPDTVSRVPHIAAVAVLITGLVITATLAIVTGVVHNNNENRLLRQRTAEVAAVLGAAIPTLQTPLVSASAVAEATNADRRDVEGVLSPSLESKRFVSASIWSARASDPRPVQQFGAVPELAKLPASVGREMVTRAIARSPDMAIVDLLDNSDRRLGYAYAAGPDAKYVVYGEAALPQNRRTRVDTNSAFADLDYAIYLGRDTSDRNLVAASVVNPNFTGRTAESDVAFGDNSLRVVLTPRGELGGTLLPRLPWIIGLIGTLITLGAALMTERLVRGRTHAESLAHENAQLFREQRSLAQTLQHSLLPDRLPAVDGLDLAVRYSPGADGVDIGGDWYDVIVVNDRQLLFVVGDVSGRGLRAATVMASLRYATHAYAAQGDTPTTILTKLCSLVSVRRDGHFATVLCGLVDVAEHRVSIANAGHPNPLLVTRDGADFVATLVGPPIGVNGGSYVAVDAQVPPGATLIGYTDGLFERRGEHPDVGLSRLRDASRGFDAVDELLDGLLDRMAPGGGHDDTAILGIQWRT